MASPRPQLPSLHTRNISTITIESDSSDTSANPIDDDDDDNFFALNNDSQSSLGAITVVRDCEPDYDLEQTHRLSPISKLPPEILIAILAKLTTTADLKNCMLVSYHWAIFAVGILWHRPLCNKWSNLLNVVAALEKGDKAYFHYSDLVKRLNLSAIADKVNDGTVLSFQNCKAIERLTLTNCSKLTDFGVAALVDGCKKLQALDVTDLDSLTDRTLHVVAQNCTKLQGLNITNCVNITDESLSEIAENCRQLKRLKLNGVSRVTDLSVTAVARNCRSILEIDLAQCMSISSGSVTALLSHLSHLRELRLAHCAEIADPAFTNLPPHLTFDALRILDLTACEQVGDDAIARIIPAAPRLRNLVLAKCRQITDRAVASICKLTKNLHYIHLGHCVNLTDNAVIQLVKACNRIRYIDLACCSRLTDASVRHLAQLPKLRRIGLVKCQHLTDASIMALAHGPLLFNPAGKVGVPTQFVSLERVHLSYCVSLTLKGITALLHNCPRLTHLSLTGVQAFLREDLTRFCRDAPAEFTHPQRDVFCVFSGEGVQRLRDYLMRLAMDEAEREGREPIDDSLLDGVDSPGADDTMSDDGTIDGMDQGFDPSLNMQRQALPTPWVNTGRPRPSRPRSLHELPSYHVDMPLFNPDQMTRFGVWTPGGPLTPEMRASLGPAHLNLMSSSQMAPLDMPYEMMQRGLPVGYFDQRPPTYESSEGTSSRTPSRRHTLNESSPMAGQIPPSVQPHYSEPVPYDGLVAPPRNYRHRSLAPPVHDTYHNSSHLWNLGMRSATDIRQTYLTPERDYSTFEANHEAIMATVPGSRHGSRNGSRSGSRHPSRSNSPHPSRVGSRLRLTSLANALRNPAVHGAPNGQEGAPVDPILARYRQENRSRTREYEDREALFRRLAEQDTATQFAEDPRLSFRRQVTDRSIELPLLHPDMIEPVPMTPVTATATTAGASSSGARQFDPETPQRDESGDVQMTQ